jgi:hypothetical protein
MREERSRVLRLVLETTVVLRRVGRAQHETDRSALRHGVEQPVARGEPDAPAVNVAGDPLGDDDTPVVCRARAVAASVPDLENGARSAANEFLAC